MQLPVGSIHVVYLSILLLPIHALPTGTTSPVEAPNVGGSDETGWQSMPHIPGAFAHAAWSVDAGSGAVMAVYQTTHQNPAAITRAVIMSSGKQRDCWSHLGLYYNALNAAAAGDRSIKPDSASIMAPCWFTDKDLAAGAAKDSQLIFAAGGWMGGGDNIGPANIKNFSTLKVLDGLVAHYMNRTHYPNLKTVVVAGHSGGGQPCSDTAKDGSLQFWIANPASYAWLTSDRPVADDKCEGVDDYKYGLGGNLPPYAVGWRARTLYRGIARGIGDTRCQAKVQGGDHLARGQNFVKMLQGMEGGMPKTHTATYVDGVGHDPQGMIGSAAGSQKTLILLYPPHPLFLRYTAVLVRAECKESVSLGYLAASSYQYKTMSHPPSYRPSTPHHVENSYHPYRPIQRLSPPLGKAHAPLAASLASVKAVPNILALLAWARRADNRIPVFLRSAPPNTGHRLCGMDLRKHGVEKVIMAGMIANTCLESSARYAVELGYHVTLVKDATAAWSEELYQAATTLVYPLIVHDVKTVAEIIA
ncbi:hypothetical protein BDZ89DRAFT_1050900 [Hymenopellis radicata]|nr:hypothetical protein BDZ89DRAFT_1050900 [Hymenopellis radicata]